MQDRSENGLFGARQVDDLFDEIGLPRPTRTRDVLAALKREGRLMQPRNTRGVWKLTPNGRVLAQELVSDMDVAALLAEAARPQAAVLAATAHPVIPPSLAPPALIGPLHEFLAEYPFERNVFGMTRFPSQDEDEPDPIAPALDRAAEVCAAHGLVFHLASDRHIVDDLWPNVAAHMWACRYGVAFFESRTEGGLNYNLSIEVGSSLVLGRRMALLKDRSLKAMPTDLVGHIYLDVDLDDPETVSSALNGWITSSLAL